LQNELNIFDINEPDPFISIGLKLKISPVFNEPNEPTNEWNCTCTLRYKRVVAVVQYIQIKLFSNQFNETYNYQVEDISKLDTDFNTTKLDTDFNTTTLLNNLNINKNKSNLLDKDDSNKFLNKDLYRLNNKKEDIKFNNISKLKVLPNKSKENFIFNDDIINRNLIFPNTSTTNMNKSKTLKKS